MSEAYGAFEEVPRIEEIKTFIFLMRLAILSI